MGTVLIVGGASGLGGVAARLFGERGDRVVLADEEAGPDAALASFLPARLADAEAPAAIVAEATTRLGSLDTLVVAAARVDSAPLAEWSAAMWDAASAINLRLPFLLAQAAAPLLAGSDNGCILFVSSTATRRGQPLTPGYQATKAGLDGLTRALAAELGPQGTRVNCVLPGWIETPLTDRYWRSAPDAPARRRAIDARIPLGRHGSAEEAAALLLFLASPAARYITGGAFPVDGGDSAV